MRIMFDSENVVQSSKTIKVSGLQYYGKHYNILLWSGIQDKKMCYNIFMSTKQDDDHANYDYYT